jgi:hypothetical protein
MIPDSYTAVKLRQKSVSFRYERTTQKHKQFSRWLL